MGADAEALVLELATELPPELWGEAWEELTRAVGRWTPEGGASLRTFLRHRRAGVALDVARAEGPIRRSGTMRPVPVAPEDLARTPCHPDLEAGLRWQELLAQLPTVPHGRRPGVWRTYASRQCSLRAAVRRRTAQRRTAASRRRSEA